MSDKGESSGSNDKGGSTSGSGGSFGTGGPGSMPSYDPASVANSPSFGTNSDFYFGAPNQMGGTNVTGFGTSLPFSADSGSAFGGNLGGNVGGNVNPSSWNSSISNPTGTAPSGGGAAGAASFAPPVGFGTSPTDMTNNFDPFSTGQPANGQGSSPLDTAQWPSGPVGAPGSSNALTPDQMGSALPAAARPTGPAASSGSSGSGGGEKSILESLGIKNPLSAGVGAAGLAYSMFQGQQPPAFSPEMQAQAAALNANGQQLLSYLNSGTLPPGLKTSLEQATSAAKTKAISNAAAQGQPTDPTKNTALAAQLNSIDQQAIISTAQMGQQLMDSGLKSTGMASDLYKTLAGIDQAQSASIGKAIANFASSLGGGSGGGLSLKLG